MLQKLTLELDTRTIEFANKYANTKGKSLNDLFEMYLRFVIINESMYSTSNTSITSMFNFDIDNLFEKETNWDELDKMIAPYRKGLPIDYKFDRELANER